MTDVCWSLPPPVLSIKDTACQYEEVTICEPTYCINFLFICMNAFNGLSAEAGNRYGDSVRVDLCKRMWKGGRKRRDNDGLAIMCTGTIPIGLWAEV